MAERFTIGLPSKGRIHEEAKKWLAGAGVAVMQGAAARGYSAVLAGLPECEVRLLSAGEIAGALDSGTLHVGVTGLDLLSERPAGLGESSQVISPLGFSAARVVVAIPDAWVDVETMEDLREAAAQHHERTRDRLRVATKFRHLTRRFFAEHGILDYRIVSSLGATEGAPAAGSADLIVDLTETGSTLAANQLRIVEDGIVLKSQAVLAGSLKANWSNEALMAYEHFAKHFPFGADTAFVSAARGGS